MAYTRLDHSEDLIHFTRDGEPWTYEGSYRIFYDIIQQSVLKSSNKKRLGDIYSLCFTEAPIRCLTENCELNPKYFSRYSPFGFLFSKKHIYDLGGLPVIYSPNHEFEKENNKTNWRTVSYDPILKYGEFRDYTWEREWRIQPKDNEFVFNADQVKLIFPSRDWAIKFRNDHDEFHKDQNCDCHCNRNCKIIEYDEYMSKEKHNELSGTCPDYSEFPWLLINMNCKNIPEPKYYDQ